MAVLIRFEWPCDHEGCDGTIVGDLTLDTTIDSGGDGVIRIDPSMTLSRSTFFCGSRNYPFRTGDWDDFALDAVQLGEHDECSALTDEDDEDNERSS
jgi:hypothetical protein